MNSQPCRRQSVWPFVANETHGFSILFATLFCVLLAISHCINPSPVLVWNRTASVARGLYFIWPGDIRIGELVLVTSTLDVDGFAARSGYISPHTPLLKHVAALAGDTVCRTNRLIAINDVSAAVALDYDDDGVALPFWSGCYALQEDDVFLLNSHPLSFDGRYFGVSKRHSIIGRAYGLGY